MAEDLSRQCRLRYHEWRLLCRVFRSRDRETSTFPPAGSIFHGIVQNIGEHALEHPGISEEENFLVPWQSSATFLSSAIGSKSSQALRTSAAMSTSSCGEFFDPGLRLRYHQHGVDHVEEAIALLDRAGRHGFIFAQRLAGGEGNLRQSRAFGRSGSSSHGRCCRSFP